jgi:epoxyqueuosine reductase
MGSKVTEARNKNELRDFIKARAASLGFCLCGITDNSPLEYFPKYQEWIQKKYHGSMAYMASERHVLPRSDPRQFRPWIKSIVMVAWPYPLTPAEFPEPAGLIAGYVSSKDYHLLLPEKLNELVDDLRQFSGKPLQSEIFTDSSPILERELAVRAGLGWIGRNSCLISTQYGSAFLLAEVFLDIELPADNPYTENHCGTCQRCRQACPTNCIQLDCTIDARNCISTLTIENKSLLPVELAKNIGNHLFGCDACQLVCPWNRPVLSTFSESNALSITNMLTELSITEEQFKQKYADTPILRAKRRGWIRNICAVLSNLKIQEAFVPLTKVLFEDQDPLCRIAAAASLVSLDRDQADSLIREVLKQEQDLLAVQELNSLLI